ncbi:hypothetical protein L873DRAFT_1787052 [Choiromyces venosus 120613-1]|uniref:RanBD1 domain-containing protein n=1 Tax=Choiromyces venosus 120613-1 TaxID=1336337 RepID=A0A3N4JY54_9PEZI|nr:hypothetical protein L873DRAFT_1787052 [Choiromyces venosus 120613-1]
MTNSGVATGDPGAKSPSKTSLQSIARESDKDDNSVIHEQDMDSLEPTLKGSEAAEDEEDSGSLSGSSDNERVREKLKKTSIANVRPESAAAGENQKEDGEPKATDSAAVSETDQEMGEGKPRRIRKRSIEETDPNEDINMGNARHGKEVDSRHRVHERKRSREISDDDMAKAARALNRVKTPPTHPEEDEIMGHNDGLHSASSAVASPRKLERKRSRNRFDGDDKDKDADRRKKPVPERKEERDSGMDANTATPANELSNGKVFGKSEVTSISSTEADTKSESKISASSGFSNTSAKSPFATASVGSKPLFGGSGSSDMFKKSAFGAMSGSAASPFATLGSTSHSSNPFGALGSTTPKPSAFSSSFGSSYGPSGFGSLAGKAGDVISSAPKLSGPIGGTVAKPFGAPDDDDEKTDDENGEGSGVDSEVHKEPSSGKETFTQQEIATGEEGEITIFKCPGKMFSFDKENKVWKERGKGTFKLNTKGSKSSTSASAFGLNDTLSVSETEEKKSARILMRTDGTYTLILNVPIFKGMIFGDHAGNKPTSNQFFLLIPNSSGGLDSMTLKLKSAAHAKELYDHVKNLHEELFS